MSIKNLCLNITIENSKQQQAFESQVTSLQNTMLKEREVLEEMARCENKVETEPD